MANYPAALPSSTPAMHGEVSGEITAIANELGLLPKGEYSSVKARLDATRSIKRRVLPESFGATGNTRQVYDASITAGTAALTSATAAFTSGDVGRSVQVMGAGSGGTASLVTTISTVTSSTTATLAATATTTVTGVIAVIGTDDQVALQNCLNSLGVGDAMYVDPTKAYMHSGVLVVGQQGSGIVGRGVLIGTDQVNHSIKVTGNDVLIEGVTLRMNADARQLNGESGGLWATSCARLTLRNILVDGAGSSGIMMFGASEFLIEDVVVQYTRADGIHMTYGSRDGIVKRPVCRYVGDDGVAVVSYQGDGVICQDIAINSPRCLGESGGRGVSVVGGQDVTYTDVYVERANTAGVYIGAESSYTTYGVQRVKVVGARLISCNTSLNGGMGAVAILNDTPTQVVDDVRLEAFIIDDTPTGIFDQVKVITYNSAPITRVLLSQFTINRGSTSPFTYNGPASSVSRVNWVQDGRALPDVIGWGQFASRPWPDGTTGTYNTGAAYFGAVSTGQTPVATGELLTPRHTGRGTRLLVAGDSGKLWFARIDQTRKSNLPYGFGQPIVGAGVSVSTAQVAGTTGWRVGIYADDGTGSRPTGAALFDAGAGAVLTATGDKMTTVAWTLVPGIYWIAFGYQETSAPTTRPTLVTFTGGLATPGTSLATFPGSAWYQTGFVASSALPTVGTLTAETTPPLIGLKI